MATNPDRKECSYLIPNAGDLRYVDIDGPDGPVRMLQRYEWSYHLKAFDWFDIHAADEDKQ